MDFQTLAGLVLRHALTTAAGILVAHGYLQSSMSDQFVAAGLLLAGVGWSWWQKSGQAAVAAELAMLKSAPPQARPPVNTAGPKVVGCLLALLLASALLSPGAAHAQSNRVPKEPASIGTSGQLCDPLRLAPGCKVTETTADDLLNKLDKLALPDFQFALAQAQATNNVVTAPCWQAWIDLITARQKAAEDAQGNPLPLPDPHLITGIERISELLAILRPDSKISLACVQIASAAKQDVALFVTSIITGGALGLFKLPVPIGPIP